MASAIGDHDTLALPARELVGVVAGRRRVGSGIPTSASSSTARFAPRGPAHGVAVDPHRLGDLLAHRA